MKSRIIMQRARTMLRTLVCIGVAAPVLTIGEPVQAQWISQYEQAHLPAPHNWAFRNNYQNADRLFNAFDYGHAILYEELYTRPNGPVERLERTQYDFITRRLLVAPPRLPLAEAAIQVQYARLVPEAALMFEWAHSLHRVIYDIWADERMSVEDKDAEVERALRYYRSRPELAFSSQPKNMELMEGQHYSLAFRQRYPKFNGLIWAYHWLQVGLYDAMMSADRVEDRQRNVSAAVGRFWQMLENPPNRMPRVMPMTAAVAPRFAARYPEAAIIFDNLHGLHDVISDVLASAAVPRNRKRAEILLAAARYRDDTSFVMTRDAWLEMSRMMGAENMGGVADPALLAELPEPTLPLGATHEQAMTHGAGQAHDEHHHHHQHEAPIAAEGTAADSAMVVGVVERFHRALESGDSAAVLALLTDDAIIMESGGTETLQQYRAHHLGADIEFARAMQSERRVVAVTVAGSMASVASSSRSRGEFRGRAVDARGAELMVLRRTPAGWRIVAIHWSAAS